MPHFPPAQLAADTAGTWQPAMPGGPVTGVAIDSRTVRAGELFVALRTDKRDGHDFVAAAAERGAAAALVARFQPGVKLPQLVVRDPLAALQALARTHRARFDGPVVGVTGSAGKTSTKDLLAVLLGEPGEVLATEGNLNNHLGVPLTLLRLEPGRHRFAVIEAGISGPGEMDVIAAMIAADVAVITTVAAAHLDGLGSVPGVAREKARLAVHRRPGGPVILPASSLQHVALRELAAPMLAARPRHEAASDLPAVATVVPFVVQHTTAETQVQVEWGGAHPGFQFRRVTNGMAANAVLALLTARHLGVADADLRTRLPRWQPAALRGELRQVDGRIYYIDCYNANPASMRDAVETFVALVPAGMPRLFVVGCMEELGRESADLHRAVGAAWPLQAGDRLVVLGEQAGAFAAGATTHQTGAAIVVNPSREEAARLVREAPGAVFLKGSRRYALETLAGALGGTLDPSSHRAEVAA